jgi:hypothetical protein
VSVKDKNKIKKEMYNMTKKENKKATIIQLIEAGKSNVEISAALKCSYNYVFSVRKEYEKEKQARACVAVYKTDEHPMGWVSTHSEYKEEYFRDLSLELNATIAVYELYSGNHIMTFGGRI